MHHLTLAESPRTRRRRTVRKLNVKEQRVSDTFPNLWAEVLKLANRDLTRIKVLSIAKVEVYPIPYMQWRRQHEGRRAQSRRR